VNVPLQIGLHPLWLDSDPLGGIATYWMALFEHLEAVDPATRYTVYFNDRIAMARSELPGGFLKRRLWPSTRWIEIPISLPLELYRRPVDLLHAQTLAPAVCPVPFVLTVNDLAWETNPEVFPPAIRLRLRKLVPRSAHRARLVLTVSEFTKKCLMEFYGLDERKIVVTYHGISSVYRPVRDPAALQQVRVKHNLPERFVLYVGKIQARKNLPRLLAAFSSLVRQGSFPHHLVLVGKRTWTSEETFASIDSLGLTGRVVVTGEVPLEELALLYAAAEVFVFPSLAEGFGLPPLEAMACGTPVISSNATSLPEVVGDAGVLVDPYDVDALARAILDVTSSERLRRELREKGIARAATFSNRRMAELTHDAYKAAISR
jgi:glycosyltransferase involved in cell wall biosynthesis